MKGSPRPTISSRPGIFSRLSVNQPVVRRRVAALLAQTRGVRVSVIFTRLAAAFGFLATVGSIGVFLVTLAGALPGHAGALLAEAGGVIGAACTLGAALGPKMTEAAGLCRQAEAGQVPFFKVLPQILTVFRSAPQIVRQFRTDAADEAQAAEAERLSEQAQASRAALVTDMAAEIAVLLKTGSYRATPGGLIETGILAGASAPQTAALPAPVAAFPGPSDAPATPGKGQAADAPPAEAILAGMAGGDAAVAEA